MSRTATSQKERLRLIDLRRRKDKIFDAAAEERARPLVRRKEVGDWATYLGVVAWAALVPVTAVAAQDRPFGLPQMFFPELVSIGPLLGYLWFDALSHTYPDVRSTPFTDVRTVKGTFAIALLSFGITARLMAWSLDFSSFDLLVWSSSLFATILFTQLVNRRHLKSRKQLSSLHSDSESAKN